MTKIVTHKYCKKCGKEKDASCFYKASRHSDGLTSSCKQCTDKINKIWVLSNKEKVRGYIRKWTSENIERVRKVMVAYKKANKEVIALKAREYAVKNADRISKYQKEYYERNKDRKIAQGKEYRRNHPEKNAQYSRDRRSKKHGSGGRVTQQEWENLLKVYGGVCLCCGKNKKLTMDHIVPLSSGGKHSIDNIQPLCISCNSKKGVKCIDYRKRNYNADRNEEA